MSTLAQEINKFQEWANSKGFSVESCGEWECDYANWEQFYEAVESFLKSNKEKVINKKESEFLLYALARDNESEHILEIFGKFPKIAIQLAQAALNYSDSDARWQIAVLLGRLQNSESKKLLERFLSDENEYVRRRSGFALST